MDADSSKKPVSFSFSSNKKGDNVKIVSSKLRDESVQEPSENTDFIQTVEDKKINGSVKKPEKKELVIPLITKNRWRLPAPAATDSNNAVPPDESTSKLDELAAQEIIQETLKANEGWENKLTGVPANIEIPLFMQNRVPSGFETDEKVDVSLRADQSTLDDYDAIPVEAFGMAMLRGMGWKASEGIGLSRKGVAAPVEVKVRPKGLGLGADRSVLEKTSKATAFSAKKDEEELKVIVGAYVQLLSGKHQGQYGQIESMDANLGRVLVRMAVGGNGVDISELFLKPVTAKEYKDSSRILNKEKYDKYKTKQEKERQEKEEEEQRRREEKKSKKKRKHSRSKSRSRSRSRSKERSDRKKDSKSKRRSREREDRSSKREGWLHAHLRVRCVDSKFKDGQYYKQKMVVIDVISKSHCICKAENGRLLDNVSVSKLETVIPRTDPAYVMVVAGKRRGQICELIERNKEQCIATVQTLPDRDEVFQIDYDDICEYLGDVRSL